MITCRLLPYTKAFVRCDSIIQNATRAAASLNFTANSTVCPLVCKTTVCAKLEKKDEDPRKKLQRGEFLVDVTCAEQALKCVAIT